MIEYRLCSRTYIGLVLSTRCLCLCLCFLLDFLLVRSFFSRPFSLHPNPTHPAAVKPSPTALARRFRGPRPCPRQDLGRLQVGGRLAGVVLLQGKILRLCFRANYYFSLPYIDVKPVFDVMWSTLFCAADARCGIVLLCAVLHNTLMPQIAAVLC